MSVSTTPRVSVIIPFYNDRRFLAEAIESVLGQSCRDFEIVLVDDGGSDGSREIAENFAEKYPKFVRRIAHVGGANLGCAASRNHGVEVARGTFVALLDADDLWVPEKIEEQLALFDKWPELDLVAGANSYWRSWEGGVDEVKQVGPAHDIPISGAELVLGVYPLGGAEAPCPSGLMIRRSAYQHVGGSETEFRGPLQLYEDQTLLTKLYLEGTCLFSSRSWHLYRQHDQSCMAGSAQTSNYAYVRAAFLDWLSTYLRTNALGDARITSRVKRLRRNLAVTRTLSSLRSRIRKRSALPFS